MGLWGSDVGPFGLNLGFANSQQCELGAIYPKFLCLSCLIYEMVMK